MPATCWRESARASWAVHGLALLNNRMHILAWRTWKTPVPLGISTLQHQCVVSMNCGSPPVDFGYAGDQLPGQVEKRSTPHDWIRIPTS
jgi:hypothetical protein